MQHFAHTYQISKYNFTFITDCDIHVLGRYVLVKYAVRGVAQDGRLSPLFSHLYALCAAIPMLCNLFWNLAGLTVGWGAAYIYPN